MSATPALGQPGAEPPDVPKADKAVRSDSTSASLLVPIAESESAKPADEAKPGVGLVAPPQVRKVRMVSSMIKANFQHGDVVLGQIDDVAFDLATGQLALVVVVKQPSPPETGIVATEAKSELPVSTRGNDRPQEIAKNEPPPDIERQYALLPYLDYAHACNFQWPNDHTVAQLPEFYTREIARKTYSNFDRDIYWMKYLRELNSELSEKFDDRSFELATFSYLTRRSVIDEAGETVGKIVDLCIDSSKGDVLYCVMESKNKELRAIPLGAFVMPSTSYRWLIELPREEILNFAPFDLASPPSQVDHAWQEYVAVRYGRTGLQPEAIAQ